jgi:hypothetical protein
MCDRSHLAEKRASEKRVAEAVSRTMAKLRELYPGGEALKAYMQRAWDEVKDEVKSTQQRGIAE